MVLKLIPKAEGPAITLDRPIVFVGRDPECDIRIDSRKISRRHCCIAQLQDRLVIRDLGSTNGLRHNGQRVHEAELRLDDEVTIGDLRYRLVQQNGQKDEPGPGAE